MMQGRRRRRRSKRRKRQGGEGEGCKAEGREEAVPAF